MGAIMPRPQGKAKKIAYKVLGVPPNIADKKTAAQKRRDRMLLKKYTMRIR